MKVLELMNTLYQLNAKADIVFKEDKTSNKVRLQPDSDNVFKQKVITVYVGTKGVK